MPASSRVAVVTGANKGIGIVAKQLISSGSLGTSFAPPPAGLGARPELGGSFLPLDVGDAELRAKFVEELTASTDAWTAS